MKQPKKYNIMKKNFLLLFATVLVCMSSCKKEQEEKPVIYFELEDVQLTSSPFKHAMENNVAWMMSLEPDRLMSGFRLESGLPKKADKYGGWESQGVAGQTFGHYLSACAMLYAVTKDEEVYNRIKYCISELDTCQQAMGNGLIASFPNAKKMFEDIGSGNISTKGFDLNGGWVPLYTMHKLIAGLVDVVHYTDDKEATRVMTNLCDFFVDFFGKLSDDQIQTILISEHGGLNEAFANAYDLTKNKNYLDLSLRLNHKAILEPLAAKRNELSGKHANTQIPKVIGCLRQYDFVKDESLYTIADFYWNTVINEYLYVIGGTCEAEHFGVPGRNYDRITDQTCENCNTYNMLKLTKMLFEYEPTSQKADYYERALYNQILGSQHPETGMICYMSPLATGSKKKYCTPYDSFWCCVGTAYENHVRYGEFIYHTNTDKDLYVNLFIPSILTWKDRRITFEQSTKFPDSDIINYTIKSEKPQTFALNLRIPSWSTQPKININGQDFKYEMNNGYAVINRKWKNGDKINYTLPQHFSSEPALGDTTIRAYLYGPIVLSGVVDPNDALDPVVVTPDLHDMSIINKLKGADGKDKTILKATPREVEMRPYYQSADEQVMVYLNHFTPDAWEVQKKEYEQRKNYSKWLSEATVSSFQLGEMQPERDHELTGVNMELPGEIEGRKYRKAINGGELSFTMNVLPDHPQELLCTFYGNLGDIYKFDVIVDNHSIATVLIHWWGQGFFDKPYRIPYEVTKGKTKVNVKLKAIGKDYVAGPLFECRVISKNSND